MSTRLFLKRTDYISCRPSTFPKFMAGLALKKTCTSRTLGGAFMLYLTSTHSSPLPILFNPSAGILGRHLVSPCQLKHLWQQQQQNLRQLLPGLNIWCWQPIMTLLLELVTDVLVCSRMLAIIELLKLTGLQNSPCESFSPTAFLCKMVSTQTCKWLHLGLVTLLLCAPLIRPDRAQVVNQLNTAWNKISPCCSALGGEFKLYVAAHKHLVPEKKREKDKVAHLTAFRGFSLFVCLFFLIKERNLCCTFFIWGELWLRKHRRAHEHGLFVWTLLPVKTWRKWLHWYKKLWPSESALDEKVRM